jgi:hypothetical protein
MNKNTILLGGILIASSFATQAATIADWTFETSKPTTLGIAYSPEVGSGSATAFGQSSLTDTAGNGSANSLSGAGWDVGDYWQFQVSTVGFQDLSISYDQTGSGTGPGSFLLEYSLDGSSFTPFGSAYTIAATTWSATGAPKTASAHSDDLSAVTILEGAPSVFFRVLDNSVTDVNGTANVGTSGTSRIDNFMVNGTAATVPEPSSLALAAVGGFAGLLILRRKR